MFNVAEVFFKVAKPEEFKEFCQEECGIELTCGHKCEAICHKTDRSHKKEFKCMKIEVKFWKIEFLAYFCSNIDFLLSQGATKCLKKTL